VGQWCPKALQRQEKNPPQIRLEVFEDASLEESGLLTPLPHLGVRGVNALAGFKSVYEKSWSL
jgi:hypothetical protein